MDRSLLPFPLLYHPSKYHPDTEDLTADEAAQDYWLGCFESGLHMVSIAPTNCGIKIYAEILHLKLINNS
jgi:hypothetical protein